MEGNGWDSSAQAWIEFVRRGDPNREYVLDPVMLEMIRPLEGRQALDVGCGEGRFCRMMSARGALTTGIDPTAELIELAKKDHPEGRYVQCGAESLPFTDESFDLVVSYLSLIDIEDYRTAIGEMARVLRRNGKLAIANLNSFATTRPDGWQKDAKGNRLFVPVDNYFDIVAQQVSWRGIKIVNWHRPFEAYMQALLRQGLRLVDFCEPRPTREGLTRIPSLESGLRVPWFHAMLWEKDR